jgi:hypothetical protein
MVVAFAATALAVGLLLRLFQTAGHAGLDDGPGGPQSGPPDA